MRGDGVPPIQEPAPDSESGGGPPGCRVFLATGSFGAGLGGGGAGWGLGGGGTAPTIMRGFRGSERFDFIEAVGFEAMIFRIKTGKNYGRTQGLQTKPNNYRRDPPVFEGP